MKFVRLKYKLKLKNRTQKFSKLWSKTHFSAILKIAAKEKVATNFIKNYQKMTCSLGWVEKGMFSQIQTAMPCDKIWTFLRIFAFKLTDLE
jgi:hypothetical protein